MLTFDDAPTIRNAIIRRLDQEPGVAVADIKIFQKTDCIEVKVWLLLVDVPACLPDLRAFFDLPPQFEHKHLINEIDQIAEQSKETRRKLGPYALFNIEKPQKRETLNGTGLRGLWANHGAA